MATKQFTLGSLRDRAFFIAGRGAKWWDFLRPAGGLMF
jgi:hypothetical protein